MCSATPTLHTLLSHLLTEVGSSLGFQCVGIASRFCTSQHLVGHNFFLSIIRGHTFIYFLLPSRNILRFCTCSMNLLHIFLADFLQLYTVIQWRLERLISMLSATDISCSLSLCQILYIRHGSKLCVYF